MERLEQLNLQQQQQQNVAAIGNMPGISSILAQPTPTSDAINANLRLGLGLNFLTLPQANPTSTSADDHKDKAANATPFNTPARPTAPKPIRTSFDPAAIELKLKALGEMPLTPPYDEDVDYEMPGLATSEVKDVQRAKEVEDEDTPLDVWVQYRIEEAKRREEFEKESAEVLMSTSPLSITAQDLLVTPAAAATTENIENSSLANSSGEYEDACGDLSSSSSSPTEEKEFNLLQEEQDNAIVVTQGKRISVRDSRAIATLKRRSRLMGLHKEAESGTVHDIDGLIADDHDMQVDEFGMKIEDEEDKADKVIPVGEAEVAMSEDRTVSITILSLSREHIADSKCYTCSLPNIASSHLLPVFHIGVPYHSPNLKSRKSKHSLLHH